MVVLTEDGVVLAFGTNDLGQLGLDKVQFASTPTPITYFIENNIKICDVICGDDFTLFVSTSDLFNSNSQIYGCGSNNSG